MNTIIGHATGYTTYTDVDGNFYKEPVDMIAVFATSVNNPMLLNAFYPLNNNESNVYCGIAALKDETGELKIVPATKEEIRMWRNANGPACTARHRANTPEKVKDIHWIKLVLKESKYNFITY